MSPNLLTLVTLLLTFKWIICSSNETYDVIKNNITEANFAVIVLCTNNYFFCTGVLVAEKWVLTSAHCLYDIAGKRTENDNSVVIVAGTESLSKAPLDIKSEQAQIRRSNSVVIHKNYSWEENFVNDIALIEVTEAFKMTEKVAVAVLQTNKTEDVVLSIAREHGHEVEYEVEYSVDETSIGIANFGCDGYGYGRTSLEESAAVNQQHIFVNKHCHCLERIRSYKSPFNILRPINSFMCGDSHKLDRRLCSGDNGGPVMCNYMLRGIATTIIRYSSIQECYRPQSEPVGCGSTNSMYVFTDLCYHNEWLRSKVPSYPQNNENC